MTIAEYAQARDVDFDAIPQIDLSDLADPNAQARIGAQIVAAATTVGFFYVKNHGIPAELQARAFAAARAFFAMPVAAKETIAVDQNQRGWMAQGMTKLEGSKTHDAKEVFFWGWDVGPDDAQLRAGVPMVAQNQWPDAVAPKLRRDVMPYYLSVVALGRNLMRAIALGLGQDCAFFTHAYEAPLARGQMVYYPAMSEGDVAAQRFGAAAHSDFGALTILMQDEVGGLQVQNKAGDWIAAPPIPGALVCNIGDLLERWSNGRLVSTKHRVLNASGRKRYSIPIFFDPNSETVIDPRDLLDDPSQADYAPITAGDHIAGRNTRNFTQYKA